MLKTLTVRSSFPCVTALSSISLAPKPKSSMSWVTAAAFMTSESYFTSAFPAISDTNTAMIPRSQSKILPWHIQTKTNTAWQHLSLLTLVFEQVPLNVGHTGGTGHSHDANEAFLHFNLAARGQLWSGAIADSRLFGWLQVRKVRRSRAHWPGLFMTLDALCRFCREGGTMSVATWARDKDAWVG